MTTSGPDVNFKALLKRPAAFIAYGFGSGLSPIAPGTFGTLVAIPLFWLIQDWSLVAYLGFTLAAFLFGIWICQLTVDWIKQDDPGGVVWDEVVGYLVTMIAAPKGWLWIVLGFILFRFFDILKPWPVSLADKKLHGGFGVMFDDVVAGIYAAFILQLLAVTVY
ncbi:phosphatidylglycerophosphatase A family protein [Methylophaga sp.]|uniref:phosphatidylglycerophosphatase A family protein n=1 Tax=Methylophaga sp. TaxID=2024840 RepID=UPI003F69B1CA